MYKIKQIPEDFIVEEIPEKDFNKEKGKYSVYLLKKTNYNTEDAVQEVCRHLNLQRKNLCYAGAKDRNAISYQYISIQGNARELLLKDLSLTKAGFTDSPISLGSLKGNKFQITIRNLEDEDLKKIERAQNITEFVNYFDSQRFSKNNSAIGKLILNKKYKEACELIFSEEAKLSAEMKEFLDKHKNAYLNALKIIPRKIIMIYLHAYQSMLWNKAVEEMLKEGKQIEKIPLLGFGTELDDEIKESYEKILSEENITLRDFILRDFPEISLEGDYRKVKMKIENLKFSDAQEDELNEGKSKITVEFSLDKGAYATMAVKNLVGEQNIEDAEENQKLTGRRGVLLTFEGGECAGKSIQIKLLKERLLSLGLRVNANFWEPGSTLNSEVIRLLTKNKYNSLYEYPGDFIETFDLEKYRKLFAEEKIPEIAQNYLRKAMEKLGSGMKYETIYFILNNKFMQGGKLLATIKKLNEEKNNEGTPAEWLFKNYFAEEKLSPEVQAYLFLADRNILYNVIKKELLKNDVVMIDRSKDSSTVYQGHAQNPAIVDKIRELNLEATEGIVPDVTILLDMPVEEIDKRKVSRGSEKKHQGITKDFFDAQQNAFHQCIRDGYLKEVEYYNSLPKSNPEYRRIKLVDAVGTPQEVHERVWKEVAICHDG